jgi:hypothetical protein
MTSIAEDGVHAQLHVEDFFENFVWNHLLKTRVKMESGKFLFFT